MSPLRSRSVQSKRIKHPAFDDSDSEDDTKMSKAMQFQLLLNQDAKRQESSTSPLSSTLSSESASSSKLFHAIPSPFKRLQFPQYLPHFHSDSKPQFLIVNETLPKPAPAPPAHRSVIPVVPAAPISHPRSISPPRERTRRYSLDEVLPDYADTTSRSKETSLSRSQRTFDFKEPLKSTNRQEALGQEPGPELQKPIPIPVFNHVSPWSNSIDSRVQDLPQSTLAPDTRDSFTTPFSPAIITDPPLGLFCFEKPKLELSKADLVPEPSGGWTPQPEGLKKLSPGDVPIRNIKISAPASLDNATNFVDFQSAPRTAPLPPSSDSSPSAILKNSGGPLTGSAIASEERPPSGSDLSQADVNRVTNEPIRKVTGFSVVAKVAGRLLRSQPQTPQTPGPVVKRTSLPPLLYSASTPIEQHTLAISTRIKDEFKMKLRDEIELPVVDAATEEELVLQLQDMNEDVGQCSKDLAKLLHRSSTNKKGSKSTKTKKVIDIQSEVRTKLNSFLVTRVLRPFSIQLNEKDDNAVRDRYEEIAPSVPQFIASRWRVVASASTSRPIQELGPALANLAADASTSILRNYSPGEGLIKETKALLIPLIRHAYLLAHFNHLEMITADYDIFCGTEIGAPIILSQEEEKHLNRHSKARDSRVSGYWSLGLRKKRYVGGGAFQRRVWDVLLKSQVLTSTII